MPVESIRSFWISESEPAMVRLSSPKRKFSVMKLRRSVSIVSAMPFLLDECRSGGCPVAHARPADEAGMPGLGGENADEGGIVAKTAHAAARHFRGEFGDGSGIEQAGRGKRFRRECMVTQGLRMRAGEGGAIGGAIG